MFNQRMPGSPPGREIALFATAGYLGYTPPDVTALIATLGGNAAVAGFYDVRTGITVNPGFGTVSSWADARGGGFGPPLVQATQTRQPSINSDGSLVTVASLTQNLTCAASALYAVSGACTLVFVGAVPGAQTGTAYACAVGAASGAFLGITQLGGSNLWGVKAGGVIVQAQTTVSTTPSPIRVAIAGITGTTPATIAVPNKTGAAIAIGTANAAGNQVLCVGGFNGASGNSNAVIRAVIFMPSSITYPGALPTAIANWAVQNQLAQTA